MAPAGGAAGQKGLLRWDELHVRYTCGGVFYAGMNFTYDIRAAGLGQHVAERMGYTWDSIFME